MKFDPKAYWSTRGIYYKNNRTRLQQRISALIGPVHFSSHDLIIYNASYVRKFTLFAIVFQCNFFLLGLYD
jgi:hypothetical protein